MSLVELIRDYLHDTLNVNGAYDRYTNDIILKYINLGIIDFVNRTGANKTVVQLPYPTNKIPYVTLPKGKVTKITVDGCSTSVVNGKLGTCDADMANLKTPTIILKKDTISVTPLGKSGDNLLIDSSDLTYGLLTPFLGTLGDLSDYKSQEPLELDSPYGAIRTVKPILMSKHLLLLEYLATPEYKLGDDFPLDAKYELCIKHFVCGHLLRDDKESQDLSLGREELGLYEKCALQAEKEEDSIDEDLIGLDDSYVYTIPYRGIF